MDSAPRRITSRIGSAVFPPARAGGDNPTTKTTKCQMQLLRAAGQAEVGSREAAMPTKFLVIAVTSATSTRAAALSAASPAPCSRTC
jgi:hypothetical protein